MDSEQKWYKVISRYDDLRGPSASPQQYKNPPTSAGAAQCYTPLLSSCSIVKICTVKQFVPKNKKPTLIVHKNEIMNIRGLMSQILKAAPQSCFPLLKTISKIMYRFFRVKHLPVATVP
jgi:hypothetical protein